MLGVAALAIMLTPLASKAVSGLNAGDIPLKIYTKQGNDWFKAITVQTQDDGGIVLKDVLPGHYKGIVNDNDVQTPQYVAAKFKMLDNEGRRINHKTDVNVYTVTSDGTRTLALATATDRKGWITLAALLPNIDYLIDVEEDSDLDQKDGRPRVKVKAKIDDSKWYQSNLKRLNSEGVLKLRNVPSGKYKFKYKSDDASPAQPFTLKLRLLRKNGKEIKKKTGVNLYAYIGGARVKVAKLKTTSKGWITVPGVMTGMKYKIEVKD